MAEHSPITNDKKIRLYGKKPEGAKGSPMMDISVYRGNPSIAVFPADDERKPINARFDPFNWGTFITLVRDMADAEPDSESRIEAKTGKPDNTFVDCLVLVGKDSEGVVYIALNKKDRPTRKFELVNTRYMDFVKKDGTEMSRAEKSRLFARGWINQIENLVNQEIFRSYEPPQQQPNRGGGGGGNTNFGDDIPF